MKLRKIFRKKSDKPVLMGDNDSPAAINSMPVSASSAVSYNQESNYTPTNTNSATNNTTTANNNDINNSTLPSNPNLQDTQFVQKSHHSPSLEPVKPVPPSPPASRTQHVAPTSSQIPPYTGYLSYEQYQQSIKARQNKETNNVTQDTQYIQNIHHVQSPPPPPPRPVSTYLPTTHNTPIQSTNSNDNPNEKHSVTINSISHHRHQSSLPSSQFPPPPPAPRGNRPLPNTIRQVPQSEVSVSTTNNDSSKPNPAYAAAVLAATKASTPAESSSSSNRPSGLDSGHIPPAQRSLPQAPIKPSHPFPSSIRTPEENPFADQKKPSKFSKQRNSTFSFIGNKLSGSSSNNSFDFLSASDIHAINHDRSATQPFVVSSTDSNSNNTSSNDNSSLSNQNATNNRITNLQNGFEKPIESVSNTNPSFESSPAKKSDSFSFSNLYKSHKKKATPAEPVSMSERLRPTDNGTPANSQPLALPKPKEKRPKSEASKNFSNAFSSVMASGAATAATAVKAAKLATTKNSNGSASTSESGERLPMPSVPGSQNDSRSNSLSGTGKSSKSNTMTSMISSKSANFGLSSLANHKDTIVKNNSSSNDPKKNEPKTPSSFTSATVAKMATMSALLGNTNNSNTSTSHNNTHSSIHSSTGNCSSRKGKFTSKALEGKQWPPSDRIWVPINESSLLPGSKSRAVLGNGTFSKSLNNNKKGFGDHEEEEEAHSREILRPLLGFSVMSYNVLSNLNSKRLEQLNFIPSTPSELSSTTNTNSYTGTASSTANSSAKDTPTYNPNRSKTTSLLLPSNFNEYLGHHHKDKEANKELHGSTHNVSENPLKLRKERMAHVLREIKEYNPDIICLQELDAQEYYSQISYELAQYESVYAPKHALFGSGSNGFSPTSANSGGNSSNTSSSPGSAYRPKSMAPSGTLPPIGGARGMAMGSGNKPKQYLAVEGSCILYRANKFYLIEKRIFNYADLTLYSKSASAATKRERETFVDEEDSLKFASEPDTRERVAGKSHIGIVAVFRHIPTGRTVIVANTQLIPDLQTIQLPQSSLSESDDPTVNALLGKSTSSNSNSSSATNFSDVRLVQIGLCLEQIDFFVQKYTPKIASSSDDNHNKVSVLLCGDMKTIPESSVYEMVNGVTPVSQFKDWGGHKYARFTDSLYKWEFAKRLDLRSAYQEIQREGIEQDQEFECSRNDDEISLCKSEGKIEPSNPNNELPSTPLSSNNPFLHNVPTGNKGDRTVSKPLVTDRVNQDPTYSDGSVGSIVSFKSFDYSAEDPTFEKFDEPVNLIPDAFKKNHHKKNTKPLRVSTDIAINSNAANTSNSTEDESLTSPAQTLGSLHSNNPFYSPLSSPINPKNVTQNNIDSQIHSAAQNDSYKQPRSLKIDTKKEDKTKHQPLRKHKPHQSKAGKISSSHQIVPFTKISYQDESSISDYIFYSSPTLAVSEVLGPSQQLIKSKNNNGFNDLVTNNGPLSPTSPTGNSTFSGKYGSSKTVSHPNPSDHLCLMSNFVFKV